MPSKSIPSLAQEKKRWLFWSHLPLSFLSAYFVRRISCNWNYSRIITSVFKNKTTDACSQVLPILMFQYLTKGMLLPKPQERFTLDPGKHLQLSPCLWLLSTFTERLLTFTFMYPFLKNPKVFRWTLMPHIILKKMCSRISNLRSWLANLFICLENCGI